MKKLFTNLLLAVLLSGFTSAAPTDRYSLIKVADISVTGAGGSAAVVPQPPAFEIHPLDILALKFD